MTVIKSRVLIADDNYLWGKILTRRLENEGFEVHQAFDGDSAWKLFNEMHFDICLLDVTMPGIDGFELSRRIRTINKVVPVIFTSGRCMDTDRLAGLMSGGDDYLAKPFVTEELMLKMNNFICRSREQKKAGGTTHNIGNYTLDLERLTLSNNSISVDLSALEVKLLLALVKNARKVVSREEIMKDVWGRVDRSTGRSLDVFISKLRKRFKDDPHVIINTIRSKGYRLRIDNDSPLA